MDQILATGLLTLQAGTGIALWNSLSVVTAGKPLVIDADYEVAGDGTLTIAAGKTIVSNQATMELTAWDVDFAGGVNCGGVGSAEYTVSIHGSKVDQTIGLGNTAGDMHLNLN